MSLTEKVFETTDNELLMQFVRLQDEDAFRKLVERHAGMVMSVCRNASRHEQDAEDAFQATLLILAGQAGRLLHSSSLGGWLHRVAQRTAARAGKLRAKRRETPLVEEPELQRSDALEEIHFRQMQQLMHEELQQLPLKYRNAIVLCDLEGKTRAQAADQLDCTEPAIKAALARGRRQLRLQLLKRGVVLSVALTMANSAAASARSITSTLVDAAVDACLAESTSGAESSASIAVQSLVREGSMIMRWSLVQKSMAATFVAAILVAAPLVLLAQISIGPPNQSQPIVIAGSTEVAALAGAAQLAEAGEQTPAEPPASDSQPGKILPGRILHIRVPGAPPIAPINGLYRVQPSGTVALGPPYGSVSVAGLSFEAAENRLEDHLARTLLNPSSTLTDGEFFVQGQRVDQLITMQDLMNQIKQLRTEVSRIKADSD